MSIRVGTKFDITDGPSDDGVVDCFRSTFKKNVRSTHTWDLVLDHVPLVHERELKLTKLEYESGGEHPQYEIKGWFTDASRSPIEFAGLYDTRKRQGWIKVTNC